MAKTRSRPISEPPQKPPAPRRWPLALVAGIVLCLVIGALAFHWWINQPVLPTSPTGSGSHSGILTASGSHVLHPASGSHHQPPVATTGESVGAALGHATAVVHLPPASHSPTFPGTATNPLHRPEGGSSAPSSAGAAITSHHPPTPPRSATPSAPIHEQVASAPPSTEPQLNPLPRGFEIEAYRQTEKERWAFAGLPRPVATGTEYRTLRRQAYVLGYSENRKDPLWVAYRLDRKDDSEALKRPGGFKTDKQTSSKIPTKAYVNSGYDRGHMAPNSAIARRFGEAAQQETFLMSNVIPQAPELNQGIWERLERREEKYANSFGHLYVFTGPIFDSKKEFLQNQKTLEDFGVEIPDAIFKILVKEDGNDIKTMAFRFPNGLGDVPRDEKNFSKYLTTIDQIERETGLDFFAALTDTLEEQLEASKATMPWEIQDTPRTKRSSD